VAINLESIKDSGFTGRVRAESEALLARVVESGVTAGR
jgi:hypothetical protein